MGRCDDTLGLLATGEEVPSYLRVAACWAMDSGPSALWK